ncbi:hypothetical protein [Parabacteroides merdae]|uniref:hypothetical protein n=1 Tax=Parabacteroides merdae TaxID=46503 RepID=UPI00110632B6|nr:hypothetical protein [Parabacteroides merdae]MCB6307523.1 hypothetical protein [Parabacteroides merdae]MCG4893768.1 hypothetical protein [Parabacteroides merdae]MCG4938307.1 hypothetical protein [Parabacteroides merdae]MCQ5223803.1 hypothetical protein [Parabacteroides merdae]
MYNLIYTMPFTNVDGEALTVQILEDGGTGSPVELTGGTPPFIVDVNDEDFLYTPTRFSGATLKLVGSDYLQKLFSTQYQKFKVNLVKAGSVIWTGFITPELYSQDYDNSLFELEIECISALSTLEYIDFKQEGATVSLLGIIKKCITESKGDFRAVYIPNVYTSSLDGITVSTANFIDEDGKAMTLKECLEEVCKFLNWTVTEYDGCIYFIDMDYIKAGKTSYTNILTSTTTTLSSTINLRDIPSKGNSNLLSILGGYNKAIVIDSDYEVDSDILYPELELNLSGGELFKFEKTKDDIIYKKEYYNSNLELFNYVLSNNSYTTYDKPFNTDKQSAGAVAMRKTSYGKTEALSKYSWQEMIEIKQKSAIILDNSAPYYLYKDIYHNGEEIKNDPFILNYPAIKCKGNELSYLVFDPDIKLCINFDIYLTTDKDGFEGDFKPTGLTSVPKLFIPMQLRIGDHYYNGSSWVTDSNTIFKVSTTATPNNYVNTWLQVYNYNDPELNVPDLNGYIVSFKSITTGDIELTIYNPAINPYSTPVFENPIESFFIRNIEISTQRVNASKSDSTKQDTKYENVVNEGFINALDDIEFKITSKNESELSYSKAMDGNSILDVLTNNISNNSEKPEKLLIQRIINQYKQPKIKLVQVIKPDIPPYSKVTDSYLSGKQFVFTGGRINYEDNSIECNLIELN